MNSNQKKKKVRFNVIDLFLIIVALISITSLVFLLKDHKIINSKNEQTVTLNYTVVLSPVRSEFYELIKEGDTVIDATIMEEIGEVLYRKQTQYKYIGTNKSTGEKVSTDYTGMLEITLTIKVEATKTLSGYEVNGQEIVIGKEIDIRVPNFTGKGVIKSVEIVDNE